MQRAGGRCGLALALGVALLATGHRRDNDVFAAVSQALRQDGNGGRGAER